MPFAANDRVRILKYRAYKVRSDEYTSVTLLNLIQQQMSDIETNLPDLVPVVQSDLDTLDILDAALTTEQGNVNATLIQADTLRWAENKTGGIQARFDSIRKRVAQMLSQEIGGNTPRGMGTLMRG